MILGLCDTYIDRHGSEKGAWSGKQVAPVEDIKAEEMLERGRCGCGWWPEKSRERGSELH
jgi:hypothetical protein